MSLLAENGQEAQTQEAQTQVTEQKSQSPETKQESQTPTWYYSAPTDDNEGVAGNGEVPDWFKVDKYKSLEDQAKAYSELEKKFGGFTGAPEEYSLPEDMADLTDDPLYNAVAEIGKESNMSNETLNKLIQTYQSTMQQQQEQFMKETMESLGEKGQERIGNIQNWLNVNAPKEIVSKIAPMATTAESIEALEWMISQTKNTPLASSTATQPSAMTQSEYAEMLLKKDAYGNLKISTDREYKKKMDELAERF